MARKIKSKKLKELRNMTEQELIDEMGFDSQPSMSFPDMYPELVEPFEDKRDFFVTLKDKPVPEIKELMMRIIGYGGSGSPQNLMVEPFRSLLENTIQGIEEKEELSDIMSDIEVIKNMPFIDKGMLEEKIEIMKANSTYAALVTTSINAIESVEKDVIKNSRKLDIAWLYLEHLFKKKYIKEKEAPDIDELLEIDQEPYIYMYSSESIIAVILRSVIVDRILYKEFMKIANKGSKAKFLSTKEFLYDYLFPELRKFKKEEFMEFVKEDVTKLMPVALSLARADYTLNAIDLYEELAWEDENSFDEEWLPELLEEHFDFENIARLRKFLKKCIEENRLEDYVQVSLVLEDKCFGASPSIPPKHDDYFKKLFESAIEKAKQGAFDTREQYDLYFTITKESYLYDSDIELGFANKRGLFNTKAFAEFIKIIAEKQWKEEYLRLLKGKQERKALLNKENFKLLESYEDASLLDLVEKNYSTIAEAGTGIFRQQFRLLLAEKDVIRSIGETDIQTREELLKTYIKHNDKDIITGLANISLVATEFYKEALDLVRKRNYSSAEFVFSLEKHDLEYLDDLKVFISSYSQNCKKIEDLKDEDLPENLKQKIKQAGLLEKGILELENKGEKIRRFLEILPEVEAFQNKDKKIKEAAFGIKNKRLYSCLEELAEKTGYFHNLNLSQFNRGTDKVYTSIIEFLSQLRARQTRTIAGENSEAGNLFYYIIRYSDEEATKELLEVIEKNDKSGKDLEKFLQHKYDACLSSLKTRIKEKISNPSVRQEIDMFIDTALENQIERFYQFLELDKEGKYMHENIPTRVAEIIECEQQKLLNFAYQQIKKGIEPEKLNDILTFYQDDKDFEEISPKEMGMLD